MCDYTRLLPDALDHDLSVSGWNGSSEPYPGIIPTQFAMQHLRRSFLKKFRDGADASADEAALALFLRINAKCEVFKLDTQSCFTHEAVVIGEARDFLYEFFYDVNSIGHPCRMTWSNVYRQLGVGNGANIGSPGTDFLSKVGLSSMSTSDPGLINLFDEAIRSDRVWARVESTRRNFNGYKIVKGSRLAFVPKTRLISRTVCTEPLLNMFFQMGIGLSIRDLLQRRVGIDLSTQPDKNRALALLGSATGRFGTIDLSSASDSMSLSLVRSMFPQSVVTMLERTRTSRTALPGGSEVELHMVSSMGNAYTFPLQTLFFCSIVLSVYKVLGIKPEFPGIHSSLGNFAVFGDDIIVEKQAYDLVIRCLSICGFSVNEDKSFNSGDFRESCGHDYLYGHNVRGVYLKTLKRQHDIYSAINRLNRWSCQWGIPLPTVTRILSKSVRTMYVPMYAEDTAGIKVPFQMRSPPLHVPKRLAVTCKANSQVPYKKLRLYGDKVDVSDDSSPEIEKLKGWLNSPNPDAIFLSALAGKLRDGFVSIRSFDRIRTRLIWGASSSWDYVPPEHRGSLCAFGDGWKSVIELNLNFYKV